MKEAKKAAALAAGIDWISDDSDDESPVRNILDPTFKTFLLLALSFLLV